MRKYIIAVGFLCAVPVFLKEAGAQDKPKKLIADFDMSCPYTRDDAYHVRHSPKGFVDPGTANVAVYAINLSTFDIVPASVMTMLGSSMKEWKADYEADLDDQSFHYVIADAWDTESFVSDYALISVSKDSTDKCEDKKGKGPIVATKLEKVLFETTKGAITVRSRLPKRGVAFGYLYQRNEKSARVWSASKLVQTDHDGNFSVSIPTKNKDGVDISGEFSVIISDTSRRSYAVEKLKK